MGKAHPYKYTDHQLLTNHAYAPICSLCGQLELRKSQRYCQYHQELVAKQKKADADEKKQCQRIRWPGRSMSRGNIMMYDNFNPTYNSHGEHPLYLRPRVKIHLIKVDDYYHRRNHVMTNCYAVLEYFFLVDISLF